MVVRLLRRRIAGMYQVPSDPIEVFRALRQAEGVEHYIRAFAALTNEATLETLIHWGASADQGADPIPIVQLRCLFSDPPSLPALPSNRRERGGWHEQMSLAVDDESEGATAAASILCLVTILSAFDEDPVENLHLQQMVMLAGALGMATLVTAQAFVVWHFWRRFPDCERYDHLFHVGHLCAVYTTTLTLSECCARSLAAPRAAGAALGEFWKRADGLPPPGASVVRKWERVWKRVTESRSAK